MVKLMKAISVTTILGAIVMGTIFSSFGPVASSANGLLAATTADMTLYAATTGADSNDCLTVSTPCTLQGAVNRVPKIIRHTVIVNVANGDYYANASNTTTNANTAYTGTLVVDGFRVVNDNAPSLGRAAFIIQGVLTKLVGPFTANAGANTTPTGTITANPDPGWTVNAYKGKFVQLLTGTGVATATDATISTNPNVAVIVSNTSSVLTYALPVGVNVGGNGTTFEIDDVTGIIHAEKSGDASIQTSTVGLVVSNTNAPAANPVETTSWLSQSNLTSNGLVKIRYLMFQGIGNGRAAAFVNSNFSLAESRIQGSQAAVVMFSTRTGVDYMMDNFVASAGGGSNFFINGGGEGNVMAITGCFGDFNGSSATGCWRDSGVTLLSLLFTTNVFQNAGTGPTYVCQACRRLSMTAANTMTGGTGGDGVLIDNGGYAIITGAVGGTGGKYGIEARNGSTVQIGGSTAVTGSSGDLSVDGSSAVSYTTLRAASPTSTSDGVEHSRIFQ